MATKNLQNLQCPMPQLDFEQITLGHGSGGKLTNILLETGVFNLLSNQTLDKRHDGAVLRVQGNIAFSTDSFVISPIFFPKSNIGELAINGTVNDLAMCGAIPKYLSLSFILEEGLFMTEFWEILNAIRIACYQAGVQIVTGDTKVVERGKGDKIFINTTGIGEIHEKANIAVENIKIGDKIIISGNIATHGMAILSLREGLEFETSIISDTTHLNHTVKNLLDNFGQEIHLFRDPTRGGVATVLNEIAQQRNIGIEIWQKDLPIEEQVASACEMLGLDPLYVANEGIFIAIVAQEIAENFLDILQQDEKGKNAKIIGQVVDTHLKQVIMQSQIGGKRVVSMPIGEQLPRIC